MAALLVVDVRVELLSWPPRPKDGTLGAVEPPDVAELSVEAPVDVLVGEDIVVWAELPLLVPEAALAELETGLESEAESLRCAKPFPVSERFLP